MKRILCSLILCACITGCEKEQTSITQTEIENKPLSSTEQTSNDTLFWQAVKNKIDAENSNGPYAYNTTADRLPKIIDWHISQNGEINYSVPPKQIIIPVQYKNALYTELVSNTLLKRFITEDDSYSDDCTEYEILGKGVPFVYSFRSADGVEFASRTVSASDCSAQSIQQAKTKSMEIRDLYYQQQQADIAARQLITLEAQNEVARQKLEATERLIAQKEKEYQQIHSQSYIVVQEKSKKTCNRVAAEKTARKKLGLSDKSKLTRAGVFHVEKMINIICGVDTSYVDSQIQQMDMQSKLTRQRTEIEMLKNEAIIERAKTEAEKTQSLIN